jgi:WD40 repeat protein
LELTPKDQIVRLTLSPDGRHIALFSTNGAIILFETDSGKLVHRWPFASHVDRAAAPGDWPASLCFSSDGRLLAVSHDKGVGIIDVDSERFLHKLPVHRAGCLSFAPGSDSLATADDQTVRVWNARSGELIQVIPGSSKINAITFSPDGGTIAFGGFIWGTSNNLTLWNRKLGGPCLTIPLEGMNVHATAFSPDGQTLAIGTGDGAVHLWDIRRGREKAKLAGHRGPVVAVSFTSDGKNLISASIGGTTRIWQLASMREAGDLTTRCKGIHSATVSQDANLFVICSEERGIQLFRAAASSQSDAAPAHFRE